MFSDKILSDDANSDIYSDGENIEVASNWDEIQVVSPSPISNTMDVSSAELMTKFRKLLLSSMTSSTMFFMQAHAWRGGNRGSLK